MPTNQSSQDRSSIFIISILAGTILGVVLLGLITALFITEQPASEYSFVIPKQGDTTSGSELKSTYFIDHYVNYGGKTARIPNVFCKADYDFAAECPPSITSYLEINLEEINLPIQNITGTATDFNNYIAYTVSSDKAECAQKLFVYDLKNKTAKELNVPQEVFVCGAIGTHIKTLSPGGRFIQLEATGPASAYGSWIYDIEKDELVVSAKHSPYHVFLDTGNSEERDRYMVYQSGAEDFELVSMGLEYFPILSIRDNFTGNSQELKGVLTHKDYNSCYSNSPYFKLDDKTKSLLISSSQCLGADDIVIGNMDKIFGSLQKEKTPKIEQYTENRAFGIIEKLYQQNGTWFADVDIAEFYPFPLRREPAEEDGITLSGADIVYIRNNSDETVKFAISPDVEILLTQYVDNGIITGVGELHTGSLDDLDSTIKYGIYHFELDDGQITKIQEQYLP